VEQLSAGPFRHRRWWRRTQVPLGRPNRICTAYEASAGGVYGPGTRYGSARKEMEHAFRFLSLGAKRDRGRVERRDDPSNMQYAPKAQHQDKTKRDLLP
jgi:hypothetical protein